MNRFILIAATLLLAGCQLAPHQHSFTAGDSVCHRYTGTKGTVLEAPVHEEKVIVQFEGRAPNYHNESELGSCTAS